MALKPSIIIKKLSVLPIPSCMAVNVSSKDNPQKIPINMQTKINETKVSSLIRVIKRTSKKIPRTTGINTINKMNNFI